MEMGNKIVNQASQIMITPMTMHHSKNIEYMNVLQWYDLIINIWSFSYFYWMHIFGQNNICMNNVTQWEGDLTKMYRSSNVYPLICCLSIWSLKTSVWCRWLYINIVTKPMTIADITNNIVISLENSTFS